MMRNRSTPQGGPDGFVHNNNNNNNNNQQQQSPGGYAAPNNNTNNNNNHPPQQYYHPPPPLHAAPSKGGSGGQTSLLVVIICCLCCIIGIGVSGAVAFAINTGTIQINGLGGVGGVGSAVGVEPEVAAAGGAQQQQQQPASAKSKAAVEEEKEELAEKAQIMIAEAKVAALQQHEKDQKFTELANKQAILQGAEANPNIKVDLNNIAPIIIEKKKPGGLKGVAVTKKVVLDRDGDPVTDDMLAKDIAAGHDVDPIAKDVEETDITTGDNRWDHSDHIPPWLKEYFIWHNKVTAQLVKPNWREQHYLVMTCLGGEVCGNVAHRLRPLMAMLRIAADSKRIFYIHWDMPDKLEKFLMPRQKGGIEWAVPDFVMWKVRKSPHQNDINVIHQQAYQEDRRIVNSMYNSDSFAEPYYDGKLLAGESDAQTAFHEVWNVLFKPSFMLEERLAESLHLMGLTAGEYAAAHIDYETIPKDAAEQEDLRIKVENAMNCMSNLRPGGPFLVAAQTYAIAREAIVYGKHHGVHVHAKQIAHDTSTVPSDLYTSFVEIMLMANTRCIAYNRNGYGQLGYILGWDFDCKKQYAAPVECKWTGGPDKENGGPV